MFFLVQIPLFLSYFCTYYLLLTGGCLWWAIEGLYVSGIHIVGGNICVYTPVYTLEIHSKKRTPTYICVHPPQQGGYMCTQMRVWYTNIQYNWSGFFELRPVAPVIECAQLCTRMHKMPILGLISTLFDPPPICTPQGTCYFVVISHVITPGNYAPKLSHNKQPPVNLSK